MLFLVDKNDAKILIQYFYLASMLWVLFGVIVYTIAAIHCILNSAVCGKYD